MSQNRFQGDEIVAQPELSLKGAECSSQRADAGRSPWYGYAGSQVSARKGINSKRAQHIEATNKEGRLSGVHRAFPPVPYRLPRLLDKIVVSDL
jgi:hypothetical protein